MSVMLFFGLMLIVLVLLLLGQFLYSFEMYALIEFFCRLGLFLGE